MNFGALPMCNGSTRLESRFLGEPERVEELRGRIGEADRCVDLAEELGLVTFTPDDIDWDDEVRLAIEERAAFSSDALTGMEASLRFGGPETIESKIFRASVGVAELDFSAPQRDRRERRAETVRHRSAAGIRSEESLMSINYSERIPNNVNLCRRSPPAARARGMAAGLPAMVERDGPRKFPGLRRLSAHRDLD